ncbi:MAG: ORC1-type DNA replication protein [Candidatus Aenigmatarchaeota archaeon]
MKMLLSDETLFKDENVFDFSYLPEQFTHRDAQLKSLAMCIKPAMRGAKPLNALLYGPPATGKTTAIKTVFQQLEEETDRAVAVHVNCQIYSSPFRVFSEIHKKMFGYLPPETGVPFSNVYDKIFQKLSKEGKTLIVALDDLSGGDEILYNIIRAHEAFPKAKAAVFAVMPENAMHKLDGRVRSVFQPQQISFPLYNAGEIFDILKGRAEIGFYPNVISDDIIRKIATIAFRKNDSRFGIELLKQSAMTAEKNSSRKIGIIDVDNALKAMMPLRAERSNDEEAILNSLAKGPMKSGELYDSLKNKMSYSGLYRTLKKLKEANLIEIKETNLKKGKTRIISKRK